MKFIYKGAGIALFKKDSTTGEYSVLLGKRKYRPDAGKWSIPGGGYEAEKDYDLFETAKREFFEEVGINLCDVIQEKKAILCKIRFPFLVWNTYMFDVGQYFLPKTNIHEFSELKFIPICELKNLKLAFGVKKEVRCFLRHH